MKIGTLTFHRACNYGGVLQCYALISYLRKIGYEAEAIDYRSPAIENAYKLFRFDSLKQFIGSLLYFKQNYKRLKNFREFQESHIPTSIEVFSKSEDISNQYDIAFIGSDQVWSKRINRGFDQAYWGNFNGKKASYAASMGTDHSYSEEEYRIIESYLKNFAAISTREDSLRDELQPYTDKKIITVIDPTLLLEKEDYEKIAELPDDENYIFHYQMEYSPETKHFMSRLAKQLNCKVITLMGPKEKYDGVVNEHYTVSEVSVERFIGYILKAKCVVASSFHGTALPIAMGKDFYFLPNYESDRSENLLRHIGALDRMVKPTEDVLFSSVNYEEVNKKLNDFKQESFDYINNVIGLSKTI